MNDHFMNKDVNIFAIFIIYWEKLRFFPITIILE